MAEETRQVISQLGYEGEIYDIYDEKAHDELANRYTKDEIDDKLANLPTESGSVVIPVLEKDIPVEPDDNIYLVYEDDTPLGLTYPNTIVFTCNGVLEPTIEYIDADGPHTIYMNAKGVKTVNVNPPLYSFNSYNTGTNKSTITRVDINCDNRYLVQQNSSNPDSLNKSFMYLFHDLNYVTSIDLRWFKFDEGVEYNITNMFSSFGKNVSNCDICITEEGYQWIKSHFNSSTFKFYNNASVIICTPTITSDGTTWKEDWVNIRTGFTA